jgi:hypothetical protein
MRPICGTRLSGFRIGGISSQGLWPDDRDGLEDRREPAIQLDEEQAIAVRELDPTAHLALHHNQLLPQRGILY